MNRRRFFAGAAAAVAASAAGCLGSAIPGSNDAPPEHDEDDHESHGDSFREELTSRDVEVNDLLLDEDELVVTIDYEHAQSQQGLAEVSMAFVERIQGGWGVERLEAIGRGDGQMTWHAEAEWAEQYLEDEIDAEEYGELIGDTVEMILAAGDGNDEE